MRVRTERVPCDGSLTLTNGDGGAVVTVHNLTLANGYGDTKDDGNNVIHSIIYE